MRSQLTRPFIPRATRCMERIKFGAFSDWDHAAITPSLTSCKEPLNGYQHLVVSMKNIACRAAEEIMPSRFCTDVSFWRDLPQHRHLLQQLRSLANLIQQPRVACAV